MPVAPWSSTATDPAEPASPAGRDALPAERFELPDLCAPLAVFGVVVASQLLAILLTLARQPDWLGFYAELSRVSLLLLWIGLTSAALLCRLRDWLARRPLWQGSGLAFLVVMLNVLFISVAAAWLGRYAGGAEATGPGLPPGTWGFVSRNLALGALVTAPLLRYFYVSSQWQRNVRRQAESRLNALQARIRPHFLFNSMNTIAALTRSSPVAAEQAVLDLADLFRASLGEGRSQIRLGEEIELARVYERIEHHRLGDRLRVEWRLQHLPLDAGIPGLILQPLLENAIHHGIEPSPEPGVITVDGDTDGRLVRLAVSNPVPPPGAARGRTGNRIALDNVRERLALAFGDRARLSVDPGRERFTVLVEFPVTPPPGRP